MGTSESQLYTADERRFASAISQLALCNPFLPQRIEIEREALGESFVARDWVWSVRPGVPEEPPNIGRIGQRTGELADRLRERLVAGVRGSADDLRLYVDLVHYLLYDRRRFDFLGLQAPEFGEIPTAEPRALYTGFLEDRNRRLALPGISLPGLIDPPHLFACFFQISRAFHHIFLGIAGGSGPTARLRAQVWQSVFTHDLRRFERSLYARMRDMTTLVTGPSGTGKEVVARAIAHAQYIAFDPKSRAFRGDFAGGFFPLSLSALSPTLIESELFGHRRGAFTGALADRVGWFETCPETGTVFLDEIGDLDPAIQLKLLRVLQSRSFQRLGETNARRFEGKIMAATNRDLGEEMRRGRFREDLYYRICSDILRTPSLREQLADAPGELGTLVRFLALRFVGDEEAEGVAREAEAWIAGNLGADYPWPGNVRELEQCVRNVIIRKEYRPASTRGGGPVEELARSVADGSLAMDELTRRYCTLVYARAGSYSEAGRRLGLDRRTVQANVLPDLLAALRRA